MNVTLKDSSATVVFGARSSPPSALASAVSGIVAPALSLPSGAQGGGWAGHYEMTIAGRSDDEIVAEVARIQAHHAKKCVRLDGFAALIGSRFTVGQVQYTIAHMSISERGTDVHVVIAAVSVGGRKEFERTYRTVDDIPADAEIIGMLHNVIESEQAQTAAQTARLTRLGALLGIG